MIYFLRAEGTVWVKIGWTRSKRKLYKRERELQIGNPLKLVRMGYMEGTRVDEERIHDLFADRRGSGEWFDDSDGMLTKYINDRRANTQRFVHGEPPRRTRGEH